MRTAPTRRKLIRDVLTCSCETDRSTATVFFDCLGGHDRSVKPRLFQIVDPEGFGVRLRFLTLRDHRSIMTLPIVTEQVAVKIQWGSVLTGQEQHPTA